MTAGPHFAFGVPLDPSSMKILRSSELFHAPTVSKSMRIAIDDLKLNRLFVLYPGRQSYSLDQDIEVLSILDMPSRLADLK
jgi:hypothetical protein